MVTLRVNNCCECFGLRSGSLYIAVLYMVIGIFNIVMTIIGLASAGGEVARYGRITTDGILVLLCILLLIGVLKSEYSLCIMWVVGAVVWSVLTIVFGEVATIYAGKIYCAIVVYSHAQKLREEGNPPPYSQFGETTTKPV